MKCLMAHYTKANGKMTLNVESGSMFCKHSDGVFTLFRSNGVIQEGTWVNNRMDGHFVISDPRDGGSVTTAEYMNGSPKKKI